LSFASTISQSRTVNLSLLEGLGTSQCGSDLCRGCLQEGVAVEIAEAVIGALQGELAATAVNAPMVPAEVSHPAHPDTALVSE
jgi:hypothetical protein